MSFFSKRLNIVGTFSTAGKLCVCSVLGTGVRLWPPRHPASFKPFSFRSSPINIVFEVHFDCDAPKVHFSYVCSLQEFLTLCVLSVFREENYRGCKEVVSDERCLGYRGISPRS